jgi:hypothetical protein
MLRLYTLLTRGDAVVGDDAMAECVSGPTDEIEASAEQNSGADQSSYPLHSLR